MGERITNTVYDSSEMERLMGNNRGKLGVDGKDVGEVGIDKLWKVYEWYSRGLDFT